MPSMGGNLTNQACIQWESICFVLDSRRVFVFVAPSTFRRLRPQKTHLYRDSWQHVEKSVERSYNARILTTHASPRAVHMSMHVPTSSTPACRSNCPSPYVAVRQHPCFIAYCMRCVPAVDAAMVAVSVSVALSVVVGGWVSVAVSMGTYAHVVSVPQYASCAAFLRRQASLFSKERSLSRPQMSACQLSVVAKGHCVVD